MNTAYNVYGGSTSFYQQRRNIVLGLESSNALGWTPHGYLLGRDISTGTKYVIYGRHEMEAGCLGTIDFTGAEIGAYLNREGSDNVPVFEEEEGDDAPEPEG